MARRSPMSSRILRSACMTVVWSRPPKCWPIFGSDRSVISRQRYIAIWRAVTSWRERQIDGLPVEVAEGRDADQGALELADVRAEVRRVVLEHVVRHRHPVLDRLLAKDRDAGLEVRRLYVGQQSRLEARAHPVLEARQLARRQVAGDDDLLVRVVQRVEGVEELLLRLQLALGELDVVDEEHVDAAVAVLER